MPIPPLITTTGLVLNNMMPGEGALGGYTPKGTASSEGASIMLRGLFRAAVATNDPAKIAFAKTIFDATCRIFYKDKRPGEVTNGQLWNHSWIANGGIPFNVRGPLDIYNSLAEGGYLYGRDTQATVVFTDGVATLMPAPDVVYQVTSTDAALVWNNVFSELTAGTRLAVDYYINSAGNQVFGTQVGGSFAQPAIKFGEHSAGDPGFIKLKTTMSGSFGVNYCITVPEVSIQHTELYEAWPMWRKMGSTEVSCAADAIHWFIDAYKLAKEAEPSNSEWQVAIDKMLEVWEAVCDQESNNTKLFSEGAKGDYNNFPLTYSYAFGKVDSADGAAEWQTVANTYKYTAERTTDGYVTFSLPKEDGSVLFGSESPIRYGLGFENAPLFLNYTNISKLSLDVVSSAPNNILSISITDTEGNTYSSNVLAPVTKSVQEVSLSSFYKFVSDITVNSDNISSGDWDGTGGNTGGGGGGVIIIPDITGTAFPGRRIALIGDSITQYNTGYYPANSDNRYEYYAQSMCGYFTYANALLNQSFDFEPGTDPDLGAIGTGSNAYKGAGRNWGVASSKVSQWGLATFAPMPNSPSYLRRGPMYLALNNLSTFDCVFMVGGTNDLSADVEATPIANNIISAAAALAAAGKWVFVGAITPRSRGMLSGYTIEKQDIIRQRLIAVNTAVKLAVESLNNIWFVDYYADLCGPNGIDPIGTLSSNTTTLAGDGVTLVSTDTRGNYSTTYGNITAFHDGLHPAPLGAYIMGKKFAEVCVAAGVTPRSLSGIEIPINSNFTFTPYALPVDNVNQPSGDDWGKVGWATGLGNKLSVNGNVHNGYTYGKLPDNIHFYKGTNLANQTIGSTVGTAGTYSNFMEYTWSDFMNTGNPATDFTTILGPLTTNSTWADGAIVVSLVPITGGNELHIAVNLPATTDANNRNQSFVLNMHVPNGVHGPWDNHGYTAPNYAGPELANNAYAANDKLFATANVNWNFSSAKMDGARFIINVLNVDDNNIATSGAAVSGIMNSHNFWPPSELSLIHMPLVMPSVLFKTPKINIPAATNTETRKYSQVKLEFAFDTHNTPATGTIVIKNLKVFKG